MDTIKTGKFIAEMRKEKELTQKDLADQLNVSDKLISKWETGRGLPDVSVMEDLCRILGVNVNELLSGEKISAEEYSRKAEETIMNMVQETENTKKEKIVAGISIWFGVALLFLMVMFSIISASGVGMLNFYVDGPTLILYIGIQIALLIITGQLKNFLTGIKHVFRTKEMQSRDLKSAISAFDTLLIGNLAACFLIFAVGACTINLHLEGYQPGAVGASWAVNYLAVFYGSLMELLVLIFRSRLKKKEAKNE